MHLRRQSAGLLAAAGLMLVAPPARAAPTQPNELVNDLVPAEDCEYCHEYNNDPDDFGDPLYSPYFTWRGSMMANAARDPVFWAGVAIASQDALDPAETEACIRCHSPRAFLGGRGGAIAQDELLPADLAGVECELCHRMEDDGGIGNGQYAVDDTLVGAVVPRRGPWSYGEGSETPAPPHEVVTDTFIGTSEACGTCHDVTTERERVDADGNPLGTLFNEQRTYREWANSDLAAPGDAFASCQDCHMPAVQDMAGCQDFVGQFSHAEGGRRHDLLGANRFVIELLAEDASLIDSVSFNHSLDQLDEFVRTAATVNVEGPDGVDLGEGLADLTVTVTNETGHKLPTGYSEGRVMWLEVIASYGDEVLWSSGAWDAEARTLQDDPQLRTYEARAQQHDSGAQFHLLLNDEWVVDTRIPPLGLIADPETDPVTDRYEPLDDGTWPNFDAHTYGFAGRPDLADVDEGDVSVRVRLLYLVNTDEYIEVLAEDNETNTAGDDVALLFETAGGAPPLVLAEQEITVPIVSAPPPATDSTGASVDTSGGMPTTGGEPADSTTSTTADATTSSSAESDDGTSDPGADGGDGDPDGCACRTRPGGGAWWLTLLIVGLRRRRR